MEDVPVIMRLIEEARGIMRSCGNANQWIGGYPSEETIVNDINNGHCYLCVEEGGEVIASFAFIPGLEPTYKEIYEGNWLDDKPYYVVHRLASTAASHGVFNDVMDYCLDVAGTLRIDTHEGNVVMRRMLEKNGFEYRGVIHLLNGDPRVAYEILTGNTEREDEE